jgi:hypothetical protein
MEKDIKLEKLCREFVSLDAREKDYILGISKALDFSIHRQGILPGNRDGDLQNQGGDSNGRKSL